jgi:hypothetical protein
MYNFVYCIIPPKIKQFYELNIISFNIKPLTFSQENIKIFLIGNYTVFDFVLSIAIFYILYIMT